MPPVLIGDRFLPVHGRRAIDLASGDAVFLRILNERRREALEVWSTRCAALLGLWHPGLVGLVDFGAIGRAGHFEAWACRYPPVCWKPRDAATADALIDVAGFLLSHRLSAGRLLWSSVIDVDGRPVLLPDEETAMPLDADPTVSPTVAPGFQDAGRRHASRLARVVAACGGADRAEWKCRLSSGSRPAAACGGRSIPEMVSRLTDVLDTGVAGHPRSVRLVMPEGPQGVLLRRALARTARLHGYLPVASRLIDEMRPAIALPHDWREVLAGRHVLLMHRSAGNGPADALALFFLTLGLGSDRPHVLLELSEQPAKSPTLGPVTWPASRRPLLAREEASRYGTGSSCRPATSVAIADADHVAGAGSPVWRRCDERLVRPADAHADDVVTAVRRGRHATAERLLREWFGRSLRRRDEVRAGEAAMMLGRLMLIRGRLVEAVRAFDDARRCFDRSRLAGEAVVAAVFTGLTWTDAGRLSEAEAALRAARISAEESADPERRVFAALGLARCLFWQRRLEEAGECLDLISGSCADACTGESDGPGVAEWQRDDPRGCVRERLPSEATSDAFGRVVPAGGDFGDVTFAVARASLVARVSVADGDLAGATRAVVEARDVAARSGRATDVTAACCARATVHGATGDAEALRRAVDEGLAAARSAHAPLRALRLRVLLADGLRRAGRQAEVRALISRLGRVDADRLPVVVSVPLKRVLRGEPVEPSRAVHPGRTVGSPGGSIRPCAAPAPGMRVEMVESLVEVLGLCQATEDENLAVGKVVGTLRARLRAVSAACFGLDQEQAAVLSIDGGDPAATSLVRRVIDTGLAIAPGYSGSDLEAGVPIRFGGAVVGALACRWPADAPPDWSRAHPLLSASAAAMAPCVRAVLDRRACPTQAAEAAPGEIIGVSEAVVGLRREITRAAGAPFNVVIEGESGSGKELVARAIHRLGPRRHRPLCTLNCAALTDELVEAELFGHARGAFTGAVAERKGLFEEADRGTLILDEIGELTARAQAKLLRAIQEGEVRRIGENFARPVDVRIVAASNRPLRPAVAAGLFRQDLLYRLEVIRIVVPPLRARVEDIPVLAAHCWREATGRLGSRSTLAPSTVAALARYDWPGNVRELQNVMAALAVAAGRRGSVGPDQLPGIIARQAVTEHASTLEEARRVFETRFVRAALARAGGRRARAASDLGLTRQGLAKLMARLGIQE